MNESPRNRTGRGRVAATSAVVALVPLLGACACPHQGKPPKPLKWDHRVYRISDKSRNPPTPGPQLDRGTFEGYVVGTDYPLACAWKPDAFKEYEVWVLYKPDEAGGFQRYGSVPADTYLTLHRSDKDDYGEPLPGADGPGEFRKYVKGLYPEEMDVKDEDLHVFILRNAPDTGTTTTGEFKAGLFKVWEVNHDPYVGPPVAWVWQPGSHARNLWFVYEEDTQWGYHLPGKKNPITHVSYTPAEFRLQKVPGTLNEALLDSDYDAAINAFKDWIMNDPTNDVTDPEQLKLYDHRILEW